jgi:TolA-binding protein
MECPRCFYVAEGTVDDLRCRICGRSYRPSVNVYLGLVALCYLVFVRYLCHVLTGAGLWEIKVRPLSSLSTAFMATWFRWPVDIQFRPELILILGGMLGLLVLIPAAMSILYGKRGGFLLVAIAVLLGPIGDYFVMILWALVLSLAVWIAGGQTLRMTSKVASVLLSCVPAWVVFLLCSRAPRSGPLPNAYYMPILAAVVVSIAVVAVLFPVLRALKWNARWSGLALCLLSALPIASYKLAIGEDAVVYGRLSRDYGLESKRFERMRSSEVVEQLERRFQEQEEADQRELEAEKAIEQIGGDDFDDWSGTRSRRRNAIPEAEEANPEANRQARLNNIKMLFAAELEQNVARLKKETVDHCRAFLDEYPGSPHRNDAIYTMIWASDMKVDTRALRTQDSSDLPIDYDWSRIRSVADARTGQAPFADSRALCEELLRDDPDGPYAIELMVKLAEYQARTGDLDGAIRRYDEVVATYGSQVDLPAEQLENLSLLANLADVGWRRRDFARQGRIDHWFREAERSRAFLMENRGRAEGDNVQLVKYLSIEVFDTSAAKEATLAEIWTAGPDGPLADNVAFERAILQPSVVTRKDLLAKVVADYPGRDGAAQALFELAQIERKLEGNAVDRLKAAQDCYQRIEREYPKSPQARQARVELLKIDSDLKQALGAAKAGGAAK